jgi:nicotinate-nucleotide pyrophosphorylase (carboxylating)
MVKVPNGIDKQELDQFISNAIHEDVREGDHSSLACIPAAQIGKAKLLVKEDCFIAGVALAEYIFQSQVPPVEITTHIMDGQRCKHGDIVFEINGPVRTILTFERLVLNCMQRMSGIATNTQKLVSIIADLPVKLLDTRKTTPGIRFLEKWAVRIGGGYNYRFGLYDMIMLKDNHLDAAGGIKNAIECSLAYLKSNKLELPIVVETRSINEINEVLNCGGIDRIMFDNFTPELTREAVQLVNHRFETESSGGITEKNIRKYAETGVDYISTSQMTHSVKSIDLSLKIA